MLFNRMKFFSGAGILLIVSVLCITATAQVNMVEFGKNRVQHGKFNWRFYQSPNFNIYFTQNGLELAKFVGQVAEEELTGMEDFVEFAVQRRINIVLYNHFNDYKQSNIGLSNDWPNAGGVTKLVNNKMLLYYNGDHNDLRRQIREGIAKVLTQTMLFGDDLGEFAQNQALLDLPQWLIDGYISYAGVNWNTQLDNDLKSAMIGFEYKNFYQFAFEKPMLAGHAFWYYIEERYKRENVTYLLYLARIYKNLNRATQTVCKKKFRDVLKDFMEYYRDRYFKDIRARRNVPAGRLTLPKEIDKADYFRFQANPNPKSFTYGVVEYKKGRTRVVLNENFVQEKTLWKSGVRNYAERPNPNYPLMAWDPKGTRIAMVVSEKGKLQLQVYDAFARRKSTSQGLPFEQVNDMQYMLDANTLVFSAVKGGQSDIYVYKIKEMKLEQITNDVYDDLDASYVAFPGKTGILFASNRPAADAPTGDTILPKNHYNIFLVDNWNKSEFKQISQLTQVKFGNARYPAQYNSSHFTFINDENGIGNRWAGFFSTKAAGIDTFYVVGEEILRNPELKELDSTLQAWNKTEPDSVGYFRITDDSSYTFPMTNYQSSVLESRIAGENGQVTEVNKQGAFKFLYKLRVDENTLRKRNVNARPTEYIKKLTREDKLKTPDVIQQRFVTTDSIPKNNDFFVSEFAPDSADMGKPFALKEGVAPKQLDKMKLFPYFKKFYVDNVVTNLNNAILINRFQPYSGATGPVNLGNFNPLNGMVRVSVLDLMEDIKFTGAFRLGNNLSDKDFFFAFNNYRKQLDWGLTYYRSNVGFGGSNNFPPYQQITNIYQGNITFPFNEVQSIRLIGAFRRDIYHIKADPRYNGSLQARTPFENYLNARMEYVHDNTINPANNIWRGLRYKAWIEMFSRLKSEFIQRNPGDLTFNVGFDARHYLRIYRNFTWAVRAAGDFSWGDNKFIYYLGGTDGWLMLGSNQVFRNGVLKERYFNTSNRPAPDQSYVYESLAVNLRGFTQNTANGNNAMVINSELRLPVFATLFNKPINNAFLRNFQLVQCVDLGSAWNGKYNAIGRPTISYSEPGNPLSIEIKAPGIGPFIGSYGFGARSTLLGYFVRFDAGWPMNGFFENKPQMHLSLGFDF